MREATLKYFNGNILRPDLVSKLNTAMVVKYTMYHDNVTNYTGLFISAAMITQRENCYPRRNINCKE